MKSLFWTGKLSLLVYLLVNANNIIAFIIGNSGNKPAIKGRKAIQSALESIESVSSFTHEILEVNGCSNIAYIIVKYSFTAKLVGSSETPSIKGKSLNIIKKQSDNTWKLHRVLWN